MIRVLNLRDSMEVETLKKLALMGATRNPVNLSSTILGSSIGTSPQTAARRLVELEEEGYITRTVTNEGQKIRLTEKGILRLKAEYMEYKELFDESRLTSIKGKVTTGLGEGQYYISLDGYRDQFIKHLGFDPYPGTLNIKLNEPFAHFETSALKIDGFKDASRTYGGCKCYPVMVDGVRGAIIRPDRTNYPMNLVEIISPVNFRKTLGLKDGDEIEVIIE
jgi:riboflavin kinase